MSGSKPTSLMYVISAVERFTQKRVDLVAIEAPTIHDACLRGLKLMEPTWRKKIEFATLEARLSVDNTKA